MSEKAGKRATTSKKQKSKASEKTFPAIPIWNDAMIELILNNSHDGIVILGDDFTFEYINERGLEIYGGTAKDLIGKDFRSFMKPETAKMIAEYYQQRRRGQRVPTVYPFNLLRKDGIEVTVEARVSIVLGPDNKTKTIAHFQDITKIEDDLRALEESKARYRLLVETMNDGLAIDNMDGELIYVNKAFCKMLGSTVDDLIGKHWSDLTDQMTREDVKKKMDERRTGVSARYELTWLHKNGDPVPTIISATPYFDHEGNFIGTFAVITEISDLKDEESIQFYLDLLSHDIANQLQVIMTSSGLLEREVPASYIEDARQDIIDAVDRCNRLITKVKRAGQIRRIPLSSVDLVDVIDEKTAILERVYNAAIHRSGSRKRLLVNADILLGELVWNLLENSARHNPTDNKEVWVSLKSKGNSVILSIADNGPGLSNSRKKTLFIERGHGGGVGLKLVRQMIRKYGGSIEVEDRVQGKPNEGANFIVTLQKSK